MNNLELWLTVFGGALALLEGGRRALGTSTRTRLIIPVYQQVKEAPPVLATETPLGTVPPWVRQVVERLRLSASRLNDETDRADLRQGCDDLIALYERQKLNQARSADLPKLEERLNQLADVVEYYINVQDNPRFYRYDRPSELLVSADSPEQLHTETSQAIKGFANAVLLAIRDNNISGLQRLRVYNKLLSDEADQ